MSAGERVSDEAYTERELQGHAVTNYKFPSSSVVAGEIVEDKVKE